MANSAAAGSIETRILKIDVTNIGQFMFKDPQRGFLDDWRLELNNKNPNALHLQDAAKLIRTSNIPIAIPTETVYGLAADATRGEAVRGIYRAKQRPSDNPLIVHISSLRQLSSLMSSEEDQFEMPELYQALISRFWPGPLTILLETPTPSPFAPEVSAGLPTVGIRMPSSRVALALMSLASRPLAAPSANASTKPSTTTAEHVLHDLRGRIELVLDGGPCHIGVESTIVNGLSDPPEILRPGGIPFEAIQKCPGWQDVRLGYSDVAQSAVPKAPGMKYKHYSPKAPLILFTGHIDLNTIKSWSSNHTLIGIVLTLQDSVSNSKGCSSHIRTRQASPHLIYAEPVSGHLQPSTHLKPNEAVLIDVDSTTGRSCHAWIQALGPDLSEITRHLFSSLRTMDERGIETLYVQSLNGSELEKEPAVMDRLRKAAEQELLIP